MRIAISTIALALVSLLAATRAHAGPGAIGFLGYGHTFQEGDDESFGPTLEVGATFSVLIAAADVTYWTDMDNAGDASQLRVGGRLTPPVIPLYGRVAAGVPLDGDTRDALGFDVLFGAGFEALSLPLLSINLELDYHTWTEASDIHPLELKLGATVGF